MSIIHNDTEFGVPDYMPPSTVRTRTGIVIGHCYVPPPRWDSRQDTERLQRALLPRPRDDGGWRSAVTAIVLGVAFAAFFFLTLSQ